jgi:hypothetical protein
MMINKANITNLPLDTISELGAALITFHQTHRELVMWKLDVSQAYHWMPMHKHWQMKQIHTIDSRQHVNCCNNFGSKGGYGIWQNMISSGTVVWRTMNREPWDLEP